MRAGDLALASLMSAMLDILDPSVEVDELPEKPLLSDLVDSFLDVSIAETTAALHIIATLTTDELVAARIRRELSNRRHPLPLDVAGLAELRVVRATQMVVPNDVGDDLILELAGAGVRGICLLVYIDHRYGTVVKDAFLMPSSLDDAVAELREIAAREGHWADFVPVDLADARARMQDAIRAYETIDHGIPPGETWPGLRPLLRFLIRGLPDGGTGYPERDPAEFLTYDEDEEFDDYLEMEATELAHDFLESLDDGAADIGMHPADHDLAHAFALATLDLLEEDYRWEPGDIKDLLTQILPVLLSGEPEEYARAPQLLPAFVGYCHHTGGVPRKATRLALAAIDRWTPAFLRKRDDPAVVRERELLEDDDVVDGEPVIDLARAVAELRDESLIRLLGSPEAAETLDARPLPDEELDVSGLPEDIISRVRHTAELIGGVAALWDDIELRTACRRLLTRIARADAEIFRRRSKDETAAGAIVWIILKANDGTRAGKPMQQVMDALGLRSSPSQRAGVMLDAIGVEHTAYGQLTLGDPGLLTASTRARIRTWLDLMDEQFGE